MNNELLKEKKVDSEPSNVRLDWWALIVSLIVVAYLPSLHHKALSLRTIGALEVGNAGIQAQSLFVVLLVVLVVNPLVRKFGSKLGVSRGTITAMYVMLSVGGIVVANFSYLELVLVQLQYRVSIAPALYGDMLDSISSLLIPTDLEAVKAMYVGDAAVPWGKWLYPIVLWSSLNFAMVVALTCIGVLVRRRWMDVDRLVFPWAQPILEMTREPEGNAMIFGPFWRDSRM